MAACACNPRPEALPSCPCTPVPAPGMGVVRGSGGMYSRIGLSRNGPASDVHICCDTMCASCGWPAGTGADVQADTRQQRSMKERAAGARNEQLHSSRRACALCNSPHGTTVCAAPPPCHVLPHTRMVDVAAVLPLGPPASPTAPHPGLHRTPCSHPRRPRRRSAARCPPDIPPDPRRSFAPTPPSTALPPGRAPCRATFARYTPPLCSNPRAVLRTRGEHVADV